MTKRQDIKYAENKARKKVKRRRMLFHRKRCAGFAKNHYATDRFAKATGRTAGRTARVAVSWWRRIINWIKKLWKKTS